MREGGVPTATDPTTPSAVPGHMRLPGRYARTLLLRGVTIWVVARLMVSALYMAIAANATPDMAAAFTDGNSLIRSGWTLALSAALVHLDLHRRHEVALLNNLGVTVIRAMVLGAIPAAAMETVMVFVR